MKFSLDRISDFLIDIVFVFLTIVKLNLYLKIVIRRERWKLASARANNARLMAAASH